MIAMQASLYSGTGNLLWVVEVAPGFADLPQSSWSQFAMRLCRNEGDGVMLLTSQAPYQAYFFNPDGSDGVFCGNGVRCAAFHLAQKYQVFTPEINMAGQKIPCEVKENQVNIRLPKTGIRHLGPLTLQIFSDLALTGLRMNMPNPHWVVLAETTEERLGQIGQKVVDLCPDIGGMNVEFVFKNKQGEWQVLVYERGVGITQACGSGAMAVLCVLQQEGLIPIGQPLQLRMSGGILTLQDLGAYLSLQGQVQKLKEINIYASNA